MFPFFKDKERKEFSSVEAVDEIEKLVYAYLKPLGFRKFGRTLHRFVDGDISQVVNFQNGCPQKQVYGILWVNLGVRVGSIWGFVFRNAQKRGWEPESLRRNTTMNMSATYVPAWVSLWMAGTAIIISKKIPQR